MSPWLTINSFYLTHTVHASYIEIESILLKWSYFLSFPLFLSSIHVLTYFWQTWAEVSFDYHFVLLLVPSTDDQIVLRCNKPKELLKPAIHTSEIDTLHNMYNIVHKDCFTFLSHYNTCKFSSFVCTCSFL